MNSVQGTSVSTPNGWASSPFYVHSAPFRLAASYLMRLVCIALGIANIFHASLLIIFSIICLYGILPKPLQPFAMQANWRFALRVTGIVLIFVEIPLLMRICPTSEKFDGFVRRFNENWPRAGMYVGYHAPPTSHLKVTLTSGLIR